jgi:hypothetical protein
MPILLIAGATGTAIVALLFGFRIGERYARLSLFASLAFTALCFVIYTVCISLSRTGDQLWSLRAVAEFIARGSWIGLWFTGGLFGPAVVKPGAIAVFLSALGTIAAVTVGTVILFASACMFASECL